MVSSFFLQVYVFKAHLCSSTFVNFLGINASINKYINTNPRADMCDPVSPCSVYTRIS